MGRFRNPRFAPESLERRLSPTAMLSGLQVQAEISTMNQLSPTENTETPLPRDDNGAPMPGPLETDPNGMPIPF